MAKVSFTASRVAGFKCPDGKRQTFIWDDGAPGLGLRATPNGKPTYVFQGVYEGRDIRITIGTPAAWSIKEAQTKARELQRLIDEGKDPRSLKRDAIAAFKAQEAEKEANAITVGDLWPEYLETGKPKRRDAWKPRYLEDLKRMSAPGGELKKRGMGKTRPGPIYPLLSLALVDISEDALQEWHDREASTSKHQAARALMMFRGFLRWCASRPAYRSLVNQEAAKSRAILDNLPTNERRTDALESGQVAGWWAGVTQLPNPTASAYLLCLLLSGARREEMAALKWKDVDLRHNKLTIADKVAQTRTIPLSPYVRHILSNLPGRQTFVFASNSKSGRITDARSSHQKALASAGIDHLTLHGLRRSFALLGEAAGAPAGAIAQVMGHRPSATHEGYKPRSVDALRPYLHQIEAHILKLAGVQFDAAQHEGPRLVSAAPHGV